LQQPYPRTREDDYQNGYFGSSNPLEPEDFQAKPKKTNAGKFALQ